MTIAKRVYFCLGVGMSIAVGVLAACRQIEPSSPKRQPTTSQGISAPFSTANPMENEAREQPDQGFPNMGKVVSQSRTVKNFNRIQCSFGELSVTQGDRETLTITAEKRLLDRIVSEVRDGTLYLYPQPNTPFVTFNRVKFDLVVKHLEELNLDGVVWVKADTLNAKRLQLTSSGTAQIAIGALKADRLEVDLGGASELNLAGKVTHQRLRFSGGSRYRADLLESDAVDLEINGTGEATVWANDRLDIQINGAGNVNFYGTPNVRQDIRGAGSIHPLGGYR